MIDDDDDDAKAVGVTKLMMMMITGATRPRTRSRTSSRAHANAVAAISNCILFATVGERAEPDKMSGFFVYPCPVKYCNRIVTAVH